MKVSKATTGAAGAPQARAAPSSQHQLALYLPLAPPGHAPQAPRARPRRSATAPSRGPGLPAPLGLRSPAPVGRASAWGAQTEAERTHPRSAAPASPSRRAPRAFSPSIPERRAAGCACAPPPRPRPRACAEGPASETRATPSVSRATRAPLRNCRRHSGGFPRALYHGGRGPQRLPAHGQRAGGERPGERPGSRPGPLPKSLGPPRNLPGCVWPAEAQHSSVRRGGAGI